jgi:ankyrin repeat domain-containing protein 50
MVDNCLRSIIAQLYQQNNDTTEELQTAFSDSREGQHQPGHMTLLEMLKGLVKRFDSVFIVIDALDECPKADDEREKLLNTICVILSLECDSLHMLCTSRKETDIEKVFLEWLPPKVDFQEVQLRDRKSTQI